MEFFMLYHYTYDGHARHDVDYVKPCSTSELGMAWLNQFAEDNSDYYWETGDDGFMILKHVQGQYEYDYYGLEKLVMDEEI